MHGAYITPVMPDNGRAPIRVVLTARPGAGNGHPFPCTNGQYAEFAPVDNHVNGGTSGAVQLRYQASVMPCQKWNVP